jgi:hypothetical protein
MKATAGINRSSGYKSSPPFAAFKDFDSSAHHVDEIEVESEKRFGRRASKTH